MADSDIPAEAVEGQHYHPCIGLLCAPGAPLATFGSEPPVRERDIRADERARVLAEVDVALRMHAKEVDPLDADFLTLSYLDAAAYLRDVLGAGGDVAQEGAVDGPESHGERRMGLGGASG